MEPPCPPPPSIDNPTIENRDKVSQMNASREKKREERESRAKDRKITLLENKLWKLTKKLDEQEVYLSSLMEENEILRGHNECSNPVLCDMIKHDTSKKYA